MSLDVSTLVGASLQLEPLNAGHREGLAAAADYEEIWHFMPFKGHGEYFSAWFEQRIEQMSSGEELVYVVRRTCDQLILGATAYYDIHLEHQRLSLGFTWFVPSVWGSGVNHECKLLMLHQAFETWNINRVELGADPRNGRSVHAITKLGATKEGILRQHMRSHQGVLTDTIVFSILASEWAKIKMGLEVLNS